GGQEDAVGVARVDQDAPDLLRVGEADVRPRPPAVRRLVGAVALGDVGAHVRLAGADIEDARVGGREGDGPDGSDGLAVEERAPGAAGVRRLPHAAVDAAEIEVLALARHARHREHAPAAERAQETPAQLLELRGVHVSRARRLGGRGEGQREQGAEAGREARASHRWRGYSMYRAVSSATARPQIVSTTANAMSMPAATPAELTMPSVTTRASRSTVTLGSRPASRSSAPQCVVARRPASRPARASRSEPVQTDVTVRAEAAVRRIQS